MTEVDEIRREPGGWRYICHRGTRCNPARTGPYATEVLTRERAEMHKRIHAHRHAIGTAGRFAPPQPEEEK